MFVKERFHLNDSTIGVLRDMVPKFGYDCFGEAVFYRTYSRIRKDGGQENWPDIVIRGTEGTFSIRKDHYVKNRIDWDEDYWQNYAAGFAISMFKMYWMPPGRGLWAMGSDFVYERGSMALNNCGYTDIAKNFTDDYKWLMDSLMHGVGVGFGPIRDDDLQLYTPRGTVDYQIPDTREGWVESVGMVCDSYRIEGMKKPRFTYDKLRPAGAPIKGFGGVASGPEPLMKLHLGLVECFESYRSRVEYDSVRLKVDIANKIGCCVVAGNVRRSAELACASVRDKTFLDLKNYERFPERAAHGWMSNNSAILESDNDFELLGEIAERVRVRGEPGFINKQNLKYGRIGKNDRLRQDKAVGFNPCGEMPQESRETCNVVETVPTMCPRIADWYAACDYATMYASTVSLLPTHQPTTNKIIGRNRRIGVSIIDVSGWVHEEGVNKVTKYLRHGYNIVRDTNRFANSEAGVPESIRVTTLKPGGTTPKLPGKTPGMSFPNFDYTIRRMRVQENSSYHRVVEAAGYPCEKDLYSDNTVVFEFPIHQGPAKPSSQISLWQQAMMLVWLQREWADNAVSNTLNFKPMWPKIDVIEDDFEIRLREYTDIDFHQAGLAKDLIAEKREMYEHNGHRLSFNWSGSILKSVDIYQYDPNHEENDLEPVLSTIAPLTKSAALLAQSNKGCYAQMPEEGITKAEYEARKKAVKPIDWSQLTGMDGQDEKYCEGDKCVILHPTYLAT